MHLERGHGSNDAAEVSCRCPFGRTEGIMSFIGRSTGLFALWLCAGSQISAFEDLSINRLVETARIETRTISMTYGHGALWVVSGFELIRIETSNLHEVKPDVGAMTSYPAFGIGDEAAWVAQVKSKTLYKLDGITAELLLKVPVDVSYAQSALAIGYGRVWVLSLGDNQEQARVLSGFDVETGDLRSRLELPAQGYGVALANGDVWVTSQSENAIYRVDPATNSILSILPLRDRPGPIVEGDGSLWVHNIGDGSVQRIDPLSGVVIATIETPLPRVASHVAFGGGFLWISPDERSPLLQIDPGTNQILRGFHGVASTGLSFGDGAIWVSERNHILRLEPPE